MGSISWSSFSSKVINSTWRLPPWWCGTPCRWCRARRTSAALLCADTRSPRGWAGWELAAESLPCGCVAGGWSSHPRSAGSRPAQGVAVEIAQIPHGGAESGIARYLRRQPQVVTPGLEPVMEEDSADTLRRNVFHDAVGDQLSGQLRTITGTNCGPADRATHKPS